MLFTVHMSHDLILSDFFDWHSCNSASSPSFFIDFIACARLYNEISLALYHSWYDKYIDVRRRERGFSTTFLYVSLFLSISICIFFLDLHLFLVFNEIWYPLKKNTMTINDKRKKRIRKKNRSRSYDDTIRVTRNEFHLTVTNGSPLQRSENLDLASFTDRRLPFGRDMCIHKRKYEHANFYR